MAWKNDQVSEKETAKIIELASSCLDLEGDYVEMGCYKGDTSLLLAEIIFSGSRRSRPSPRGERANSRAAALRNTPKSDYLEYPNNSHIARLIARIDEEAHRFAITYHTLLKRKSMLK